MTITCLSEVYSTKKGMKINIDKYCSCSHCEKKAGTYSSNGKHEIILYPYETVDEFKLLCIECVKKELKAINKEIESNQNIS